jgi:hypothetical protein
MSQKELLTAELANLEKEYDYIGDMCPIIDHPSDLYLMDRWQRDLQVIEREISRIKDELELLDVPE